MCSVEASSRKKWIPFRKGRRWLFIFISEHIWDQKKRSVSGFCPKYRFQGSTFRGPHSGVHIDCMQEYSLESYLFPFRFFSHGGGLCFALHLETGLPQPLPTPAPAPRRLVTYIFHPYEPFVISIQKAGYSDYVVCFHFRNAHSSN